MYDETQFPITHSRTTCEHAQSWHFSCVGHHIHAIYTGSVLGELAVASCARTHAMYLRARVSYSKQVQTVFHTPVKSVGSTIKSITSGTEGSASFWVGPMGRTGRGRGLGKILGFNSTIVRGFGFFFTIGAGLVLRIFFLCVLLAVPPNNAIRVFWLRFLLLWKLVASILGLREHTPVAMSLAGSRSMVV